MPARRGDCGAAAAAALVVTGGCGALAAAALVVTGGVDEITSLLDELELADKELQEVTNSAAVAIKIKRA